MFPLFHILSLRMSWKVENWFG